MIQRVPGLVGLVTGGRPVPFALWRALRALGRREDALMPTKRPSPGSAVRDGVLARALHDRELGTWSLGPSSIELIGELVRRHRPRAILEFGSGVSSVCLSHFAARLEVPPVIVSIEQDEAEVESTRTLLDRLTSGTHVELLHAPLVQRDVAGRRVSAYDLQLESLETTFAGRGVDLVLIDGPAAEAGARFGTLPTVAPLLAPGAVILLDDALRDGELEAASRWAALGLIAMAGIIPVDHGVLIARWSGPMSQGTASA